MSHDLYLTQSVRGVLERTPCSKLQMSTEAALVASAIQMGVDAAAHSLPIPDFAWGLEPHHIALARAVSASVRGVTPLGRAIA